jgi:hypothetical protein
VLSASHRGAAGADYCVRAGERVRRGSFWPTRSSRGPGAGRSPAPGQPRPSHHHPHRPGRPRPAPLRTRPLRLSKVHEPSRDVTDKGSLGQTGDGQGLRTSRSSRCPFGAYLGSDTPCRGKEWGRQRMPPEARMTSPVIQRASSEARKATSGP